VREIRNMLRDRREAEAFCAFFQPSKAAEKSSGCSNLHSNMSRDNLLKALSS
jgi:hypothetical protein